MLFCWLMLEEEDNKKKLILASASPRRKEILRLLGLEFRVVRPENFEEKQCRNPYTTVSRNSIAKAKNVYGYLKKKEPGEGKSVSSRFLIAGFDTLVYVKGKSLGKPSDRQQAINFLNLLSGSVHRVITGVCVLEGFSGKYIFDTVSTCVKFRKLAAGEIKSYTDREDMLDKAGAYNVLGYGSLLVEKINGCFYNIAGVPVAKFVDLLKEFGFNVIG